ncbi:hypothetical protein T492DRAFT_855510 [Pavlovales sp. CCMP2436]|nr:hypothetical protein T492DRAFT_855510 [Pavlovales sp. CCMP2436]
MLTIQVDFSVSDPRTVIVYLLAGWLLVIVGRELETPTGVLRTDDDLNDLDSQLPHSGGEGSQLMLLAEDGSQLAHGGSGGSQLMLFAKELMLSTVDGSQPPHGGGEGSQLMLIAEDGSQPLHDRGGGSQLMLFAEELMLPAEDGSQPPHGGGSQPVPLAEDDSLPPHSGGGGEIVPMLTLAEDGNPPPHGGVRCARLQLLAEKLLAETRAEARLGLDELGGGADGTYSHWTSTLSILDGHHRAHFASVDEHAARMVQIVASPQIETALLVAAAAECSSALGSAKEQLVAIKHAFEVAAKCPLDRPSALLRHYLACVGAAVSKDMVSFLQNHLVYADFEPDSEGVLCIRELLQAIDLLVTLTAEVALTGCDPAPEDGSLAQRLLREEPLLGDLFATSIWALYDSNVNAILEESRAVLQCGEDAFTNLTQTGVQMRSFLRAALTSARIHAERCAHRISREEHEVCFSSQHIGAHGNALKAASRALKVLADVIEHLADGGHDGDVPPMRDGGDLSVRKDANQAAAQSPPPPPPPKTETQSSKLRHSLVRLLGWGGDAAAQRWDAVQNEVSWDCDAPRAVADEAAGGGGGCENGAELRVECKLSDAPEGGGLTLTIKNTGATSCVPMYLHVEHLMDEKAVGAVLKERWESESFTELRTHGHELVGSSALFPGESVSIPVNWPATVSRHLTVELMSWLTPSSTSPS